METEDIFHMWSDTEMLTLIPSVHLDAVGAECVLLFKHVSNMHANLVSRATVARVWEAAAVVYHQHRALKNCAI